MAKIALLFTDVVKSSSIHEFLKLQMSFNAIRKNKILPKKFEFTVNAIWPLYIYRGYNLRHSIDVANI